MRASPYDRETKRRTEIAKGRFDKYKDPIPLTPTEIKSGKVDYPTWNDLRIFERIYYPKGKVYILDEPDIAIAAAGMAGGNPTNAAPGDQTDDGRTVASTTETTRNRRVTKCLHSQKCELVREFFDEETPYEITPVPSLNDQAAWDRFWLSEMNAWASDDLIMIYHHGNAGQNGPDFTWRFKKRPYTIDAFAFIDRLCKGPADVHLILECYLPTRFKKRFELLSGAHQNRRNVEIVATGQSGQDDEGNGFHNEFTDQLLATFDDILSRKKGGAMCSIPQAMGRAEIPGNPYRMWLSVFQAPPQSKSESEEDYAARLMNASQDEVVQVWRMRMNPTQIRRSQQLIFHKDCIRDSKREAEIAYYRAQHEHKALTKVFDEGFQEPDEDQAEVTDEDDD